MLSSWCLFLFLHTWGILEEEEVIDRSWNQRNHELPSNQPWPGDWAGSHREGYRLGEGRDRDRETEVSKEVKLTAPSSHHVNLT